MSQLNTYLMCPKKYRFRYLDRLEPERRAAALAFGSAVHSAIEWWQTERIEKREAPLDGALRIFRADWTAQTALTQLDYDKSSPEELSELGQALIRLFIERFVGEPPPEAVEQRILVPIRHPTTGREHRLPLLGYVDFTGPGLIGEIKTAARKNALSNWIMQLSAYSYAYREEHGSKPKIQVVQLIKTKVPKIEITTTEMTDEQELWFLQVATSVLDSIERGAFHPNPSWACPRCEYRQACRG